MRTLRFLFIIVLGIVLVPVVYFWAMNNWTTITTTVSTLPENVVKWTSEWGLFGGSEETPVANNSNNPGIVAPNTIPQRPLNDMAGGGAAPVEGAQVDGATTGASPEVLNQVAAMAQTVNIDLSIYQDGHPRLFFNPENIALLHAQTTTTHQEIWTPIQEHVNSELGSRPAQVPDPEGGVSAYRNYGNQLIAFAFVCSIGLDANACQLTKDYLLGYATWQQWGEDNNRDLGHAHMLLGNALAYDWAYHTLSPEERQIVRTSLGEWAHRMHEASTGDKVDDWANWWRKSYIQNHYWTNNSALGVAGLVLLNEDPRAQTWVDHATQQMTRVQYMLENIGDGSWHEGVQYQSYGLTLSLPFMVNLQKITGLDIFPHEYLQNYAAWRIYNHLPDTTDHLLAYGNTEWDWGNSYRPQNILRFVAGNYGDAYAEWMAQELIEADGRYASVWSTPWYVFEFLYYNPAIGTHPPSTMEKSRTFPDLEGVIWRTGWEDDALIFGLKTGAYGGRFAHETFTRNAYPWEGPCPQTECQLNSGHNHDDTNSFYIYKAGQWLAPEVVAYGNYDTQLHNTILIDGQGQYRPPQENYGRRVEDHTNADGFLEITASTPNFDYLASDATRRYRNIAGMEDVTRHVLFVRPGYFVMLDNLMSSTPHQYTWISHFGEQVSTEGSWIKGSSGEGQVLGVGVLSPQAFNATPGDDGQPYIHIQPSTQTDDVRFINILYPTDEASWATKPDITLLADSGEAVAVQVRNNDGSGLIDEIIMNYAPVNAMTAIGPYTTDAKTAVVSWGPNDQIARLFVYGGTMLTDEAANIIVANTIPTEAFEAIYDGSVVHVHGTVQSEITLYAPNIEQLTINGEVHTFTRSGEYITFTE